MCAVRQIMCRRCPSAGGGERLGTCLSTEDPDDAYDSDGLYVWLTWTLEAGPHNVPRACPARRRTVLWPGLLC